MKWNEVELRCDEQKGRQQNVLDLIVVVVSVKLLDSIVHNLLQLLYGYTESLLHTLFWPTLYIAKSIESCYCMSYMFNFGYV